MAASVILSIDILYIQILVDSSRQMHKGTPQTLLSSDLNNSKIEYHTLYDVDEII